MNTKLLWDFRKSFFISRIVIIKDGYYRIMKLNVRVKALAGAYQLQLGCVVLPKASSIEHLKSNLDLDFTISDDDMAILNNVKPLDDYGAHDFFPVFKHSGE